MSIASAVDAQSMKAHVRTPARIIVTFAGGDIYHRGRDTRYVTARWILWRPGRPCTHDRPQNSYEQKLSV